MNLQDVYETLINEYNSGIFKLEDNKIEWNYNNDGVENYKAAEDRWLSFLGAKMTAETIIRDQPFKIIECFESNHRIGFSIVEILDMVVNPTLKKSKKKFF